MEKTEEPNLSTFPCETCLNPICITTYNACSKVEEMKAWNEAFKASLQKRCDNCRWVAPGIFCNPALCEQKLTPKQILFGPKKPS